MTYFIEVTVGPDCSKSACYGPYGSPDQTSRTLYLHGWDEKEEFDLWTTERLFGSREHMVAQVCEDAGYVDLSPIQDLPRPNFRLAESRMPGWAKGIIDL